MNPFIVKFGQQIICKENINKHQPRKEWTDNKIYRHATNVPVKMIGDIQNKSDITGLIQKMKNNQQVLENIIYKHFNKFSNLEKTDENFSDFSKIFSKTKNTDIPLKNNLSDLSRTAAGFKNIEYNDLTKIELSSNFSKEERKSQLMEVFSKYKNEFLLVETYPNLNEKDIAILKKSIQLQEKKNNEYMNINQIVNEFQKNPQNLKEFEYHLDNFNLIGEEHISKQKISTEEIEKIVLCDEFRHSVRNFNLSNETIMKYLQKNRDIKEASEIYFKEIYGSHVLSLTIVFPDKSQHLKEFSFISNPEEIFLFVFSLYPDAKDLKIFKSDSTEIQLNPMTDKFIGSLGIPQKSFLTVKL